MERRKFVKRILEAIEVGVHTVEVKPWFDCPYTVVDIECLDWINEDGDHPWGRGCAKVCHPDPWDTATGQEIATARAAQAVAKQMDEFPFFLDPDVLR